MIQRDYIIKSPLSAALTLAEIKKFITGTPHRDVLLTIYETGYPDIEIRGLVDMIRHTLPREVQVAGISVYVLADALPEGRGVRLNLLLTETSDIEVVSIPCEPGEEDRAVSYMRERLDAHPDAKAVELMACNMGLNVSHFMRESMRGRDGVDMFGTIVSAFVPDTASFIDYDMFNIESGRGKGVKAPISPLPNQSGYRAIGDRLMDSGFVAVIFSGEDLHVDTEYALGWQPVGRAMSLEKGSNKNYGESEITRIDDMRAVDIYKEYLGVVPNKSFIANICEFPLMIRREGLDICLVPFDYGDEGELYFGTTIEDGEELRFSYASHDGVLRASGESYRHIHEFSPQALYMVICGNRINFLREESELEWRPFRADYPGLALIHGGCELYWHNGRGAILNSAHVSVGMREGIPAVASGEEVKPGTAGISTGTAQSVPGTAERSPAPAPDELHHHSLIPLSERMSVFLSKMTGQLVETAEQARAANQAKSAFLSNMSHEIRTPINAILGMDEMILRESGEAATIGYAEDIRSAGNSLLGIINDILDFSKIEAGKMDIIPVEYEFSSVVNDLYTVIGKRARDKGLELILHVDPTIPAILYGDEIRVKQVITNILTNAVKYTEKGSVTLSFQRVELDTNNKSEACYGDRHGSACFNNPVKMRVSVKDTGIGIKKEDIKKLFNAFERIEEARNRTIEGTGLGINITTQLLDLMNSRLQVESVYGEGSEFYFDLVQGISRDEPVGDINARFAAAHKKKEYHEAFTAPEAHILVVDDTELNLDVVKNLLKKTRVRIDTAISGAEAIEKVRGSAYDMIFLDHRMPHMDGMECLKIMQTLPDHKCPDAPVISLTANAVSGAREEYLTAGFADYLTKPIDPEKLEDMLIRYLPEEKVHLAGVASSEANEELTIISGRGQTAYRTANAEEGDAGGEDRRAERIPDTTVALDRSGYTFRRNRSKPSIVMIDDETILHNVASGILSEKYEFRAFTSGAEALEYLKSTDDDDTASGTGAGTDPEQRGSAYHEIPVDLILLDVKMPDEDGFTVMEELQADIRTASIPVVFLTGDESRDTEIAGFNAGAWDFVRKPFVPEVLLKRVEHTIELSRLQKNLAREVSVQTLRADHLTQEVMLSLAKAVDAKDRYTRGHSERVAGYSVMIAARLGMSREQQSEIYAMGLLHDVGKIGVKEEILNKPGRLEPDEFEQIKKHTVMGYDILKTITELPDLATGARWHHEKYNGTGYPDGLSGENIPQPARIICVADSYDAMTSKRSYSEVRPQENVRAEIEKCTGTQFDPAAASAMLQIIDEDKEYKLNQAGYEDSFVAEYVRKLVHFETEAPEDDNSQEGGELSSSGAGTELPSYLTDIPDLDTTAGISNCGSVDGYLSVVDTFRSSISDKADEIERFYRDGDIENYTIKVHALKSSARIIGASVLSGMAADLEAAGDAGDTATIDRDTGELLKLYRSYEDKLADPASASSDADGDSGLPEATVAQLEDAYQGIDEFAASEDYDLAKMVLDDMKAYALPRVDRERFDRIRQALGRLDWKEIRDIIASSRRKN